MLAKIKTMYHSAVGVFAQLKDLRVVGLLLFAVIVLMITWSGVRVVDTNYQLQRNISHLQQEISVQELANANLKLANEYYETPGYLELAAREHFGRAAPGETVLLVPEHVALANTVEPISATAVQDVHDSRPAYQRNFQAWMDFFLHRNGD